MDKAYYYKYFQFEREHWWFKARLKILENYIKNNLYLTNQSKILNVGAATGATSEMLNELGKLNSIEYDKDCLAFVNSKLNLKIDWGNILELDFPDNFFDLVCAFDVVEHVENHKKALKELIRTCKNGGTVLMTVPAHMHLWSDHDLVNHHFRRYTTNEVKNLVKEVPGASVEFISYFNSNLYHLIAVFRKINNFLKGKNKVKNNLKSDFETFKPGLINQILENIFASESEKISRKISFSNGVSIICHIKKDF
jgi:2-polyprenyl-3-methyl-5-hydroxy-6-metoxy-1,4-benzoquinol methylase